MKETKDLGLFAAYLACGAEYVDADRTDPKNIVFRVDFRNNGNENDFVTGLIKAHNHETLDEIEAAWVNRNLNVNAVVYYDALRRAKSIVHSR